MIIVGLGNPGKEYEQTRHNVGFMFLDYIAQKEGINFSEEKKFKAHIAQFGNTVLIKPQTFMNNSGEAVKAYLSFFKLKDPTIFVAHDDLDMELGKWKISDRSPHGHNGLISIDGHLKEISYEKVRIGVDNRDRENRIPGVSYVLQRFNDEELEIVKKEFEEIYISIKEK